MDLQVEKLDTHEVQLTITIPDDVFQRTRRDVARRLSKQVRIPGFRPGNAPIAAVIAAVGGEQVFMAEVTDALADQFYGAAIDQSQVEPYGPGQLVDLQQNPVRLVVRLPLEPVVDLKDYRSIRLPAPQVTATDEEIEHQLEHLREDHAIVQAVERPAQTGDLVDVSIVGTVGDEEMIRSQRPIVLDEERVGLPGLVAAIVGMSAPEHRDVVLSIPEDYFDKDLSGKDVQVHLDMRQVSSRALPEINDELAQTVGQFDSLQALREDVRAKLLRRNQTAADQEYATQVIDAYTSLSSIAYPSQFVDDRLKEMLDELKDDVRRDERMPYEDWLKVQGKTEQQLLQEMRPNAESRARRGLVMREVARVENIEVRDQEVAAEVARQMSYFGQNTDRVRSYMQRDDTRRAIQNNILSNKVIDRMVMLARGDSDPKTPAPLPPLETAVAAAQSEDNQANLTSN